MTRRPGEALDDVLVPKMEERRKGQVAMEQAVVKEEEEAPRTLFWGSENAKGKTKERSSSLTLEAFKEIFELPLALFSSNFCQAGKKIQGRSDIYFRIGRQNH